MASSVAIDNVHLVLRGANGVVILDTIVTFPPGQDEVSVTANVPVRGESEQIAARYELRSGTMTMFEGTLDVVARPGTNAPTGTSTVQLTFVGPGARATQVRVTPGTNTLVQGQTTQLAAAVLDAANAVIVDAILVWTSSNPAVATVNSAGLVTAGATRGTSIITASTIGGIAGTATVQVLLGPSSLVLTGGDAQTGTVGSALPQPFAVRVVASDGLPVPGAVVAFAANTGGASVANATVTADANGQAGTTMTLTRTPGAQTFRASIPSVPGVAAVTVTETAIVGPPANIAIVSGDAQADTTSRTLAQPFVVKVTDSFGNSVTGASIAWSRTLGSGAVSAPSTVTDATGQTSITYTLGATSGAEVIRAQVSAPFVGAIAPGVNFSATAIRRAAAVITLVSGNAQAGPVGQAATLPLIVMARDALGAATAGASIAWTAMGGSLSAATTTTDATGQAQVTITHGSTAGPVTVTAQLVGATGAGTSVTFNLTAISGTLASLAISAGGSQSATVSTGVAVPPAVVAKDQFGNTVVGVQVTFTASGGGVVTGSPATTNASGVATVGSWILGPTTGPQTLTASVGLVAVGIPATATAPVGPNTISISLQPSTNAPNSLVFAQQPVIQLKNAGGGNLNTAGVVVSVALSGGAHTLRGTLTATTNASGVATFAGLSVLGSVGTNSLAFTAAGFTGVTSSTINVGPGPAFTIAATTATALTGIVGTVVAPNPTVIVRDTSGNPVSGTGVTFAVATPINGTVTGGAATTNASGVASSTSWTLGSVPRTDTLTATAPGLAGSPVTFLAVASAGAATQLVIVSGDAQAGTTGLALAAPMLVEARDALNNPVPGVNVTFTTLTGGGSPVSQSIATSGVGRSGFTLTLGPIGPQSVKACLPSCATAQVTFTATAIPVGANATWTGSTSTSWTVGTNWSPAAVPTSGSNVYIPAGTPNSPSLSGATTVNDLTVQNTATLSIGTFQLDVTGNLVAGTTITGTGTVRMTGATKQLSGVLPSLLVDASASVTAIAATTINGALTLQNSAVLDVGGAMMTVSGTLTVVGGGRLRMLNALASLTVGGSAVFNSLDMGATDLTDGTLDLKGNFTASSCCTQSFRAFGNHKTKFTGTGAQAIDMFYTSVNQSQFQNLLITNTSASGVAFVRTAVVGGTLEQNGKLTVNASQTLTVNGLITLNTGSSTVITGSLVKNGGCSNPNLGGSITGATCP